MDDELPQHLSPFGWEEIKLTGEYFRQQSKQLERGEFRPLRQLANPWFEIIRFVR